MSQQSNHEIKPMLLCMLHFETNCGILQQRMPEMKWHALCFTETFRCMLYFHRVPMWSPRTKGHAGIVYIHTSILFFFIIGWQHNDKQRTNTLLGKHRPMSQTIYFFHYSISLPFSWVLNPAYHHFLIPLPLPVTIEPYFSLALHLTPVPRGCTGTWTLSEGNQ